MFQKIQEIMDETTKYSSHAELAETITKAHFGEVTYLNVLRKRFKMQYKRLAATASPAGTEREFRDFPRMQRTVRQAWDTGIKVMKGIACGKAPADVHSTLAFLAVARAISETLAGSSGDSSLVKRFDMDLLRWQQVFPLEDQLLAYRDAVRMVWDVDLDGVFAVPEDENLLDKLRDLVSLLVAGARGPLNLDDFDDFDDFDDGGLQFAISKWRKGRIETGQGELGCWPPGGTLGQGSSNECSSRRPASAINSLLPATQAPDPDLLPLIDKGLFPIPRSPGPDIFWFHNTRGIAEYLMRGSIFSMTFMFLHCLLTATTVLEAFADIGGISTVRQKYDILKRFLGVGDGWNGRSRSVAIGGSYSEETGQGLDDLLFFDESRASAATTTCGTIASRQWYNILGDRSDFWI